MVLMTSIIDSGLTIEERRQSLYAALLRYAPEVGELRERSLERLVMAALLGTTPANPFRVGTVTVNIRFGSAALELRSEIIQATLKRLCASGLVIQTELRKRHAYYLTPAAETQLNETIDAGEVLFTNVLKRMLKDTDHLVRRDVATRVVRGFISESFARFGRRIARVVIGQGTRDDVVLDSEAKTAFDCACHDTTLSTEARESLEARCLTFLRSREPDDEKLKFYLTQGYYFTQLLGLDDAPFNPLALDAFKDSTFFLDANILIPRLLSDEISPRFDELVQFSTRIGVRLVVTRATINEIRRVAADREMRLAAVLEKYPEKIAELTDDPFLESYLKARERNTTLTVRDFMSSFDRLADIFQRELHLEVDERVEDDMLHGHDMRTISDVFQEEALATRKWRKPPDVLGHDVAHYALVVEEREDSPKVWFLTLDRSLMRAGIRLAEGHSPFAFSLLGFLQSLSPFVAATNGDNPLVHVFSAFLAEQVMPIQPVFELAELQLIAEMHEDILQTPREKLVEAFDYVKKHVLHGEPYSRENAGRFSLGLKKFLTSSADERMKTLVNDRDRLIEEGERKETALEIERGQRTDAERAAHALNEQIEHLTAKIGHLEDLDKKKAQEVLDLEQRMAHDQQRKRFWRMLQGFGIGLVLWWFNPEVTQLITRRFVARAALTPWVRLTDAILGTLFFCIPAIRFVTRKRWTGEQKVGFLAIILTLGAALSSVVSDQTLSAWSSYIQFGTFAAMLLVYFAGRHADDKQDG